MADRPAGEERVLAVGQWLGTANRIKAMRHLGARGWVAIDSTDSEYAQCCPHRADPLRRNVFPGGLRSTDEVERDPAKRPLTPWPPAPGDAVATPTVRVLPASGADEEVDDHNLYAIWYVRHADGTEEDVRLDHGNLVEDDKGTCGQVIFYRRGGGTGG